MSDIQGTLQGLLRQKDPDEIEKQLKQLEEAQKETLALITGCGASGQAILQSFNQLAPQQKTVVDQLLLGNAALAYEQFLSDYNPKYEAVLKEIGLFNGRVQKEADGQLTAQQRRTQASLRWRGGIVATVLLGMILLGWRMKSRIASQLQMLATNLALASDTLSSSASQVSCASQSLAEGASEQAASLEETSSSLEEMSSMTKRNTASADQCNALMVEAKKTVGGHGPVGR